MPYLNSLQLANWRPKWYSFATVIKSTFKCSLKWKTWLLSVRQTYKWRTEADSGHTCAIPIACPAIPILPASRVSCKLRSSMTLYFIISSVDGASDWSSQTEDVHTIAILNPKPGFPSKFSLGMAQSSKISWQVELALMPSLSSFFPRLRPSMGFGTKKALMPYREALAKVHKRLLYIPCICNHKAGDRKTRNLVTTAYFVLQWLVCGSEYL